MTVARTIVTVSCEGDELAMLPIFPLYVSCYSCSDWVAVSELEDWLGEGVGMPVSQGHSDDSIYIPGSSFLASGRANVRVIGFTSESRLS